MRLRFWRRRAPESSRRTVKRARKQRKRMLRRALSLAFNREVRLFLAIFLGYFLHVTLFANIGEQLGVSLMLTISVISVVTVCYGRLRAFWCGLIYGILLELMLAGTPLLNLILYPASALLWSVPFSDKSAQQLEYERSIGKAGRNRSPVLRTLLCSLANSLTYEIVNLVYIYLRESEVLPVQIQTGLRTIAATVILTLIVMFPLRFLFGYSFHTTRPIQKTQAYQA